jgi:hypothetical protein
MDAMVKELRELRNRFGLGVEHRIAALLRRLARRRVRDVRELIELHETLLFIRAYPMNRQILELAEGLLRRFGTRIKSDDPEFEDPTVSGIANTHITAVFSYNIARHLVKRHGREARLDWERHDEADRLIGTLPHLTPLLDDDAMVEAVVPWRQWMEAAAGDRGALAWLLDRIEEMAPTDRLRADRYQSLQIPVRWDFGDSEATRTRMRLPAPGYFYHKTPLMPRKAMDAGAVQPLAARKLTRAEGEWILNAARDTSAMRFRELHGFTYGDSPKVCEYDAGRGVRFYLWGVPPEHRLPLRAYHAATIWKNGVPIGYFEALSLFDRMEAGFNLYYTFREGETPWLYQQLAAMFHQALGVTTLVIDPYQIGYENEEAIRSGAFWFYRKLGFRPVKPEILALMGREEKKIAADPAYRSSVATLRKLVRGSMVYDFPEAEQGFWDRFSARNLGLAAARAMGQMFDGELTRMRHMSLRMVARTVRLRIDRLTDAERRVLAEWSPLLALIPDLQDWSREEKELLGAILLAKAGEDESAYLRLMQWHGKLRDALVQLGSKAVAQPYNKV